MSSIRQEEDDLFAEWRTKRANFVPDGVVSEQAYLSSDPKLLFVMKQANRKDGEQGDVKEDKPLDLRDFLAEGKRRQSWSNISRWVHGIRNLGEDVDPEWSRYRDISDKFRRENLKSICAVNLNKSPGGSVASEAVMRKAVKEDWRFIRDQLALYDPELTVCCGTGRLYQLVLLKSGHNPSWLPTSRGIWYLRWGEDKLAISFHHPEARVQDSILFYALIDAVREICDK